jgi:hypothetical protein
VACFKVLTFTIVIDAKMVEFFFKLVVDENVEYFDVEWNNCGSSSSVLLLFFFFVFFFLLLLLGTLRGCLNCIPERNYANGFIIIIVVVVFVIGIIAS